MKYRKKPVVIEAVKFDPCGAHNRELPDGVVGVNSPGADNWGYAGCQFWIDTLEGRMTVTNGDWIITGIKGERYPVKHDIFEATYEAVEEYPRQMTDAQIQARVEARKPPARSGADAEGKG